MERLTKQSLYHTMIIVTVISPRDDAIKIIHTVIMHQSMMCVQVHNINYVPVCGWIKETIR